MARISADAIRMVPSGPPPPRPPETIRLAQEARSALTNQPPVAETDRFERSAPARQSRPTQSAPPAAASQPATASPPPSAAPPPASTTIDVRV